LDIRSIDKLKITSFKWRG